MNKKKIIIGTRGSNLAIKYAELAIKEIKKFYNGKIEVSARLSWFGAFFFS